MTSGEWNGLVVGDDVRWHEGDHAGEVPRSAVVVEVDALRVPHQIGIRLIGRDGGGGAMMWPSRLRLHAGTGAVSARCAWCSTVGVRP